MQTSQVSPYMTVEECANYIKAAPATVYKWSHKKRIPSRKHNGKLMFHREEIDAWSAGKARPVMDAVRPSKFQEVRARLMAKRTEQAG